MDIQQLRRVIIGRLREQIAAEKAGQRVPPPPAGNPDLITLCRAWGEKGAPDAA